MERETETDRNHKGKIMKPDKNLKQIKINIKRIFNGAFFKILQKGTKENEESLEGND